MRIKLGLKLWSTNTYLIPEALRLAERGSFDYIELFSVPDSLSDVGDSWKGLGLPFVIHAPHSAAGLNFSIAPMEVRNRTLAAESFRFADLLGADTVIFHPGTRGTLEETMRQASLVRDQRMVFENKPKLGLDGSICVGYLPEDMRRLCEGLGTRFCLDFGHAVAAANACAIDPMTLVDQFFELRPAMYHLTDGDYTGRVDRHDAYGSGSFPLASFLSRIPDGVRVTDEARRADSSGLEEFLKDSEFIKTAVCIRRQDSID
jgi:sugar phosphate isomerase/epimerase